MRPEIQIGSYTLPTYGLAIYLGILSLALIAYRQARKRKLATEDLIYSLALGLIGAALGAKLLYLVTILPALAQLDWSRADLPALLLDLLRSGFVIYGGIIGGLLTVYAYSRKYRINSYKLLASLVVGLPFAQALGRVGCHFAGCCYGHPYSGPLAIRFPQSPLHPFPVDRFPTQLTWALGDLLFGLFLVFYSRHLGRKAQSGQLVFSTYLIGYSLLRFSGEFLRGDLVRGLYGPLSQAQWISIPFFLFGLYLNLQARLKSRKRAKK